MTSEDLLRRMEHTHRLPGVASSATALALDDGAEALKLLREWMNLAHPVDPPAWHRRVADLLS